MTLPARYSGVCPACGGRWQPGDLIRAEAYSPGERPTWQHAVCPDAPLSAVDLKLGETACPDCWLIHPKGACDR